MSLWGQREGGVLISSCSLPGAGAPPGARLQSGGEGLTKTAEGLWAPTIFLN